MSARWVTWLAGYLLYVGLVAWLWLVNPASAQGQPSDPTARLGVLSVLLVPLALWIGTRLAKLDFDAYVPRSVAVALIAALMAAATGLVAFFPDDLNSCMALIRTLPEPPERCLTTPALRLLSAAEGSLAWLALGGAWALTAARDSRRHGATNAAHA